MNVLHVHLLQWLCVGFLPAPIAPSQLATQLLAQQKYERIQVNIGWFLKILLYFIKLQEEGGDVQEIEMEVEEEAEAEKEDLKAREARKKVTHNLVLLYFHSQCVFHCSG